MFTQPEKLCCFVISFWLMVAWCIFPEWCWLKKETVLKELCMPTLPLVYLTLLKMANSLTGLQAWNMPLILANQKCSASGTALTGTGNYFHVWPSHPGMNNMAGSTCHNRSSSSYIIHVICLISMYFISNVICLSLVRFLMDEAAIMCDVLNKSIIGLNSAPVWFQIGLFAYLGLLD